MTDETSYRLTDERLAWLAMRNHCQALSRKTGVLGLLGLIFSGGGTGPKCGPHVASGANVEIAGKMGDYAVAVDELARDLSPAERATLRAENRLPDWFAPAVEKRFEEVRHGR